MLEVKDLCKEFVIHQQDRRIDGFQGISFEAGRGDFFGISGQSGAGKSSLIKCIYRTYIPTRGKILYRSKEGGVVDLASVPVHEVLRLRMKEIGYVPQFLHVVPRVPALDIVAEPLIVRGVETDEAKCRAALILERLMLPDKLFEAYPSTFSGGEQQRINLAKAMIARFDLLLLDEPTASLDSGTKEIISDILREEVRRGATAICVSHDTHFLNSLSDRILVMKCGRMEEVLGI
jgi:alpha-D-ribose 1-methylphosphonate 5-triphosphate synthase subunit PhnL